MMILASWLGRCGLAHRPRPRGKRRRRTVIRGREGQAKLDGRCRYPIEAAVPEVTRGAGIDLDKTGQHVQPTRDQDT
jgi:hypothetical protein